MLKGPHKPKWYKTYQLILLISTQPERVAGKWCHSFHTHLFVIIAEKAPGWALKESLRHQRQRPVVLNADGRGIVKLAREPLTWKSFLSLVILSKNIKESPSIFSLIIFFPQRIERLLCSTSRDKLLGKEETNISHLFQPAESIAACPAGGESRQVSRAQLDPSWTPLLQRNRSWSHQLRWTRQTACAVTGEASLAPAPGPLPPFFFLYPGCSFSSASFHPLLCLPAICFAPTLPLFLHPSLPLLCSLSLPFFPFLSL